MVKYFIYPFLLITLAFVLPVNAQSSGQLAFNQAASLFIEGKNEEALQRVNNGLDRYPNDEKLQTLKEKLEEKKKQQEQQQQEQKNKEGKSKEDKEQQEGEKKEEENKEGENKEGEEKPGENKEGKEQEEKEGENKEGENKEGKEQDGKEEEGKEEQPSPGEMDTQQRLEEMEISPEKARMILEAMKSNEVQYLQQKKRKPSKRSGNNDRPDW